MNSPIQIFSKQYRELYDSLISQGKVTYANEVNEHYRKILLLSCASYYESQITSIIQEFVRKNSSDLRVFEFLNNKALQRQYHTFFNWKDYNTPNINNFLGLFGVEFKDAVSREIKSNGDLKSYVKAFLTIGNDRNLMVHENFLEYKLEKTFDEILVLHENAERFIDFLKEKFNSIPFDNK